jgi:hypothetical protein
MKHKSLISMDSLLSQMFLSGDVGAATQGVLEPSIAFE